MIKNIKNKTIFILSIKDIGFSTKINCRFSSTKIKPIAVYDNSLLDKHNILYNNKGKNAIYR